MYPLRTIRRTLAGIIRAREWWEYKLVPILAAFYATALALEVPVYALWPAAVTVLLALIPGAAYVSLINDLTDRKDDLASGKPDPLAGRGPTTGGILVALSVAAGLVFAYLWRHDRLLQAVYLAAWLAFSLYSLPPFRWKARGLFGVLCDASGSNLFPTLVAVALAFRGAHRAPDPGWLFAVGAWAFANGIRGILWHQLTDLENDRRAGVRTFAERRTPRVTIFLGTWIAFPAEVAALAAMLWRLRSESPAALLALYALIASWRVSRWKLNAVIVTPKPRYFIVLHEYYGVHLPFALLAASAARHPSDLVVMAAHFLLFPGQAFQALRDAARLVEQFSKELVPEVVRAVRRVLRLGSQEVRLPPEGPHEVIGGRDRTLPGPWTQTLEDSDGPAEPAGGGATNEESGAAPTESGADGQGRESPR